MFGRKDEESHFNLSPMQEDDLEGVLFLVVVLCLVLAVGYLLSFL